MLATDILNGDPGVGFVEDRYDLGLGESGLLRRSLLAVEYARKLCLAGILIRGEFET